jgi:hypothetical protein
MSPFNYEMASPDVPFPNSPVESGRCFEAVRQARLCEVVLNFRVCPDRDGHFGGASVPKCDPKHVVNP